MERYRAYDTGDAFEDLGGLVSQAGGEGDETLDLLKDMAADYEALRRDHRGAVEAARAVVRTAQAAFDDVDRGDHADLDPLRLAVRALDRAIGGR